MTFGTSRFNPEALESLAQANKSDLWDLPKLTLGPPGDVQSLVPDNQDHKAGHWTMALTMPPPLGLVLFLEALPPNPTLEINADPKAAFWLPPSGCVVLPSWFPPGSLLLLPFFSPSSLLLLP